MVSGGQVRGPGAVPRLRPGPLDATTWTRALGIGDPVQATERRQGEVWLAFQRDSV